MTQKKLSLQEQLLKAGLGNATKAKQIKTDKHKQNKLQKNNNIQIVDDIAAQVQQAKTEQLTKDRELNALQKQHIEHKAIQAQIKQLIELNCKPQDPDGLAYRFNDNAKIKTLYVSNQTREHLSKGVLAVVTFNQHYAVVPAEIAEKIRLRDASCVIVFNDAHAINEKTADDPYAAFQVPDDLMW